MLLTLPAEVFLVDLEIAFNAYRRECASVMGITLKRNDFSRALKELDGNFIATNRSREKLIVRFHNPSVRDFLENYVTANLEEVHLLVRSIVSFDQIRWLWDHQESRSNSYPFRVKIKDSLQSEFIARFKLAFELPSFYLARYWSGDKEYKDHQETSFEQRMALALSVCTEISTTEAGEILAWALDGLSARIRAGNPDKDELINLLESFASDELISEAQLDRLLAESKDFLLSDVDWITEYRPYTRFIDSFPDVVPSGEKAANADAFSKLARRNILDELDENDPDTLRMYASEIKDIAGHLNVDVTDLLREIEAKARYIEEDAEEPPRDFDDSGPKRDPDWCSDEEITSIFEGL